MFKNVGTGSDRLGVEALVVNLIVNLIEVVHLLIDGCGRRSAGPMGREPPAEAGYWLSA